ncbi:MAG TPA: ABC transporter permease [Bryobacteraceae bacterium]|nr:ABC transporter permease [Bryobacteraceae bacterium]
MQELFQDLRYGLRMLLKAPGATIVGLIALTLGIGANSAIFAVIDAILIRPLPYPEPARIMAVFENKLDKGMHRQLISPLDYKSYEQFTQVFDAIGAIRNQAFVLTGRELPERIDGASVSPGVFRILGMRPAVGRAFAADEDAPGKNSRVVISDGLWRRRFASEPGILGSILLLDGKAYTVIGIAPPGFRIANSPSELWIPYTPDPRELSPSQQGLHSLQVLGHLKAGATRRQAEIEMQTIARRLAEANPDTNAGYSAEVIPLRDQVVGNIGTTLWLLTSAAVVILLIACANIANLLLARAGAREKEIAVRTALGANPGRLVRQALTESVLLALIGGVLGLGLAHGATAAIVKFAPASIPRLQEISLDWRVLGFTFVISIMTGILFGLAPALVSLRPDLHSVLRGSGRGNTANRGRTRLRDALVVSEIACCAALLIGAGLLVRTFARLERVDPGFRTDHVLTMQLALPASRYSGLKIAEFYRQLLDRLQALPGVRAAGVCRFLPMSGTDVSLNFQIEGKPLLAVADQPRAKFRAASGSYFDALRIPIVRGRVFNDSDGEHTPKVVVINEAAARRYWPGEDPVGRRILSGTDENAWSTIIGVVADMKHAGLDVETSPETYYHYLQVPPEMMNIAESTMFLAIRTKTDPVSMISQARSTVRETDPNQPVFNLRTMDDVVQASIAQPRFRMMLLAAFGVVALLLAAIGLYGVTSYTVSQRTNELGVRMALGGMPSDIARLVVGQSLRLTMLGLGIGLVIAAATSWIISRLLFGIGAMDFVSFVGACLVTTIVTQVASLVPALRAARIQPAIALRAE